MGPWYKEYETFGTANLNATGWHSQGNPAGNHVVNGNITESVTTLFVGGPSKAETMASPAVDPAGGSVTLVWSSVEGGTYQVQASRSLSSNWTNLSTNFPAAANAITTSYVETNAAGSYPQSFYRVGRTALAPYSP